ncbi:MAG TPA: CCA tRNA nucleotidyltransferase, partial [Acetobacteraceae bacterium]|nr:CCA tRNA nucleotidyltransferase [Acetobacteraceae bacterium]
MEALPEARVVGGAVRDSLLGLPVADIDLATPASPDQVIAALTRAGVRTIPTGLGHGTVTALVDGRGYEITTLRRDVATDGRHAVVAFTDDWRTDAARRDFTLNALSMDRHGAVFDYFGGIADLRAGRIRFVGDPARRIAEDYLRILRFFRFHARYARAPPDGAAIRAIQAGLPGLARLSPERVWSELKRILEAPDPRAALALMARLSVLAATLPEGADLPRLCAM